MSDLEIDFRVFLDFRFIFSGESFSTKLLTLIVNICIPNCTVWNLYGPAETTIASTFHLVDVTADTQYIPIGLPLSNYRCLILDEFSQNVIINQEGELLVGGVGVFAGYLGRDDLTRKVLAQIDGEIFYRTGDLARMDDDGLLYYRGRKDHQIKLHGQRIELAEIERCLLDTSISACVVIKWDNDHLIAYVQSSDINEEQLREHCRFHLPPYMIPSLFIILEKLPLNANGKTDRKRLPSPENLLHTSMTNDSDHMKPNNELEVQIHSLWSRVLGQTQISIDKNFFNIGGYSLLLVQLYHNYKITLNMDMSRINIAKFLQYPTIADHARLISQSINEQEKHRKILPQNHIIEGRFHYQINSKCCLKCIFLCTRENVLCPRMHPYQPSRRYQTHRG